MKKKSGFKKFGIIMVLLFSTFILSCNKEGLIEVPDSNLSLKSGSNNFSEDVFCELTAGQTINAGNVIYEKVGENIIVTYVASNGWVLKEVHLYVGPEEDLPRNKTAIKIGQFTFSKDNLGGVNEWTKTIPIPDGCFIIAAHAVVYNEEMNKEETAWANCTYRPAIAVKTRFMDGSYAMTDGIRFIDLFNGGDLTDHWCDDLGFNLYGRPDEYILQSERKGYTDAGKVVVSDDGDNIFVQVLTKYDLKGSYVFVGSPEELGEIPSGEGACPDYNQFPDKKTETEVGVFEHNYVISIPEMQPLPNNISFETAFGSKRWGWFTSYCE